MAAIVLPHLCFVYKNRGHSPNTFFFYLFCLVAHLFNLDRDGDGDGDGDEDRDHLGPF